MSIQCSLSFLNLLGLAVFFLGEIPATSPQESSTDTRPKTAKSQTPSAPPAGTITDAERIVQLQRALEADRRQLEQLRAALEDPQSEFQSAEAEFQVIDTKVTELRGSIRKEHRADNQDKAKTMNEELTLLLKDWQTAKDRFELALQERRTLQEKLQSLERKIEMGQASLQRLRDASTPASFWPAFKTTPTAATESKGQQAIPRPVVSGTKGGAEQPIAVAMHKTTAPAEPPKDPKPPSKLQDQARENAAVKERTAREANEKAQTLVERLAELRHQIALEERLSQVSGEKATSAQQLLKELEADQQRRQAAHAPLEELHSLSEKIASVKQRIDAASSAQQSASDRMRELKTELRSLQKELLAAKQEAEQKDGDALKAQKQLAEAENPYSWANIQLWLLEHGPRVLLILLGMWMLNRFVRISGSHIVRFMSRNHKRGSIAEKETRAKTLEGVLHNTTGLLVVIGGGLMLLFEIGLPVMPLLGGAGIFGLALAFGAQNLIKDYFCGFMVLLEDQYGINDYVQIGSIEGTVEGITLRVTALRDLHGTLHFIPHGTISTVSNLTHTWSRAKVLVGVAYKENVDRVLDVLRDVVREVRLDPVFGALILDDAESMGIRELADSGVILQFYLKTKPMQQWSVRRELLRRIKSRFDQTGIEIPFPQRMVTHRFEHEVPVRQYLGTRYSEAA